MVDLHIAVITAMTQSLANGNMAKLGRLAHQFDFAIGDADAVVQQTVALHLGGGDETVAVDGAAQHGAAMVEEVRRIVGPAAKKTYAQGRARQNHRSPPPEFIC